jgi:hypothetical protein
MTSKLHIGLVTTIVMSAGSVLAQPSPPYVSAPRIPCQYGLPFDALHKLPPQRLGAAVRVSLDAQGKMKDAALEQSSGDAAFDALTVRQSRKAICKAADAQLAGGRVPARPPAEGHYPLGVQKEPQVFAMRAVGQNM